MADNLKKTSGKTIPVGRKTCPKCSDTMTKYDAVSALPRNLDNGPRKLNDPTQIISLSSVFAVDVYWCPSCRFVELYAG